MDGSPFYMYYKEAAYRMRDISPDSKVIVSLRNPVDRIESMYNMHWNRGLLNINFDEYADNFIKSSGKTFKSDVFYHDKLNFLKDILGKERFLIVLYDDFKKDTVRVLKSIYNFLEIENILPENVDKTYYSNSTLMKKGIIRNIITSKFARKLYILLPKKLVKFLMRIFNLKSLHNKDKEENTKSKQKLLDFL